jgi:hypothetical protein
MFNIKILSPKKLLLLTTKLFFENARIHEKSHPSPTQKFLREDLFGPLDHIIASTGLYGPASLYLLD